MKYIIAYDLGTGGAKASLYEETGNSIGDCFISYDTYYPKSGYHEQNPQEWWEAISGATKQLLGKTGIDNKQIECLAVSGHSLGAIPLSNDGEVLVKTVPIWSDSRAKTQADRFFETVDEQEWYLTTGNGFPAPLYAIFKQMWYKDNMPDVYDNTYKFIGTKDYINYKCTGRMCTDYSYASGSGVYDLKKWEYKSEFIQACGISEQKLPEILASTDIVGMLTQQAANELGLHTGVKVACGGVDNACMALGAGCIKDGMAYTSLGSSSWIAVSGHEPIVDAKRKPFVFTHCVPGMFASATAIFSAGNSLRWLRDNVCRDLLSEKEPYDAMTALADTSPVGANKLLFNPSLAGGSSLDKSVNVKGGFIGLQLKHTQADLIRATLEGVCLNLRIALDVLGGYTKLSDDMLIVGGGGRSQFWRSLFADIYNKNIVETNVGQDAGSLGAAAVAAVGAGIWKDFDIISDIHKLKGKIVPDKDNNEHYERILKLFEAVTYIQSDIGDMIEDTEW